MKKLVIFGMDAYSLIEGQYEFDGLRYYFGRSKIHTFTQG